MYSYAKQSEDLEVLNLEPFINLINLGLLTKKIEKLKWGPFHVDFKA
jgi:hypothetical protein